ncbi:MAG: hypothetical protein M1831_000343 [Alyxoria varia]|nr:MAG: hypothetical protein M1831_000343 [Alyxoria varia]
MTSDSEHGALPWVLGVYDAHCHITDTMDSVVDVPNMKAAVLTIMASRLQDQHLVDEVASKYAVDKASAQSIKTTVPKRRRVVPSFGWHPWFSHHLFDDRDHGNDTSAEDEAATSSLTNEEKIAHYRATMTPVVKEADAGLLEQMPDPIPLSKYLAETKRRLEKYPYALVGEVGLDKAFRIPAAWLPSETEGRDRSLTPGAREGRSLSPFRVHMDHQRLVLTAQLRLAGEMRRAVSLHGVQAPGIVFNTLQSLWKGHEIKSKRANMKHRDLAKEFRPSDDISSGALEDEERPLPYPPRICLHSYSGPVDFVRQYLERQVPVKFYFSFSMLVNFSVSDPNRLNKAEEIVKMLPDDRILVESDIHTAGSKLDELLELITRKVCAIRSWELEEGVKQLGKNWRAFVLGHTE